MESELGDLHYNVTFVRSNLTLIIEGENRGEPINASHVVTVDKVTIVENIHRVDSGETWKKHLDISGAYHAFRESHQVTVSIWGDSVSFNFEREVDVDNTSAVATPNVTDVNVTTATKRGERYAAVNVTVHNPSVQAYLVRLLVDTTETNGAVDAKGLKSNLTSSIIIPLDQPPGEVHGEVRIYGGNASDHEDAVAQVEFHGAPNGTTTFETEPYVPVYEPAMAPAGRQYRYRRPGNGLSSEVGGSVPGGWAGIAGALASLSLGVLWWRRR